MLQYLFKKPFSFWILVVTIVVASIFAAIHMPVKMYPAMVKPSFNVQFGHNNINNPDDLYKTHGRNIINQLAELKGLENYSHSYYQGWARINLEFEWDIDEEKLEEKINMILSQATGKDPHHMWSYVQSGGDRRGGGMLAAISHKELTYLELNEFLRSNLRPKINRLEGIKRVNIWGWGTTRKILEIDRNKLFSYKLDINQLYRTIRSSFNSFPGGNIGKEKGWMSKIQITIPKETHNLEELMDLVILKDAQKKLYIKLKDIATLKEVMKGNDNKIFHLNGKTATFLEISMESEGNVKEICDRTENIIKEFKEQNPGIDFNIVVNPSDYIVNAMTNLSINALIGGVVAILVILLFLGSYQNTGVIALSIPFCIITSFSFMYMFDVSINLIALGGMAVGVGMIVDSSIVSLENIHRRLKEAPADSNRLETIIKATKEVALPIFSSILTSIVVFFPIIFTKSYTKAILGDLAKTVIFTLSLSIFAALVMIPIIGNQLISTKNKISKTQILNSTIGKYLKLVSWITAKKKRSLGIVCITLILFIGSLFLIPQIKKEIITQPVTKMMRLQVSLPNNKDFKLTQKYITKIESFLQAKKEVKNIATSMWNASNGRIIVEMEDRHKYKTLKGVIEEKFPKSLELRIHVSPWDPGGLPLPDTYDLLVRVSSGTSDERQNFGDRIIDMDLKDIRRSTWQRPWKAIREEVSINFHPWVDKSAISSISAFLKTSSQEGTFLTEVIDQGKSHYLNAIFKEDQRLDHYSDLIETPVLYKRRIAPLKALAKIKLENKAQSGIRFDEGGRANLVYINVYENGSAKKKDNIAMLKKKISELDKPGDISVTYPDPLKEITASYQSFKTALIISLALVFVIIALLFNSIKYPLVILTTVPMAIIGVLCGLYMTGSTISLNSMLGTILLTGLVVNNAILFIDFYLKSLKEQQGALHAIKAAAKLRFRPILMTTLTTLLGILPIAIGIGESGEILKPLGISVFSGLLVSTSLTLFFIPALLSLSRAQSRDLHT